MVVVKPVPINHRVTTILVDGWRVTQPGIAARIPSKTWDLYFANPRNS